MMWGFGGFGFLWMVLFWVGVILLVVWAVREGSDRGQNPPSALSILEERFARGEVDADEFSARRRELASR
ncbi:MAG TPA: SHOCT domain-containing protein [Acidimicrobiia bacterium]|nr:SHOCT domain-containing protein [Acidimicrobiia bacterium]